MNIIIYSQDFEPITSIELPLEVIESAEKRGFILIALKSMERETAFIRVICHKMNWLDGTTKSILITRDEELALLLKPEWLVGQRAVIGAYQRTITILTDKLKKLRRED